MRRAAFSSEHRIITIGWTEAFSYAMSAWVILSTYPSGEAPRFSIGYEMATMFFAIEIVVVMLIAYSMKRWPPGRGRSWSSCQPRPVRRYFMASNLWRR